MRHRRNVFMASLLLLIGVMWFFTWSHRENAAPMPEPSREGGYYDEAFVLKLTAPENGTIYYTTDGSIPTAASQKYEDGIPIRNRSEEPNRHVSERNVVEDWKNYFPDPTPVEKGTVVRAVFVSSGGIASEILTQTYFVGIAPPKRGYTLSLVFEEEDLFGDNGIYVTGKEYDDWYLSGEGERPEPNFQKKTEVPVTAEILDTNGDVMNQPVGLRLQGATARGEVKKRFILVSRSQYSGSEIFETNLYDGVTTHSVMLKFYRPDALVQELVPDRDVSSQRSLPVRVYLNGEYLYDCYMLERYDTNYFRQHYGVDDRVLVKDGVVDEESAEKMGTDFYSEFMYWVRNTDFSDPEQWEQFCRESDVQSYIDYMCINYFLCNIDFDDEHNYVLWRSPGLGKGTWADMRWRWCIYDIDAIEWAANDPARGAPEAINVFSFGADGDPQTESLRHGIHTALKRSPEYCRMFTLSFMDMLNNNFSPERVSSVLAGYGLPADWKNGYFEKRPAYAVKHLAEEFGLTGALETVTVRCAQPEMGEVTVNTSPIDLSDGSWTGEYFTDYPITLTAVPRDGYRFLGWMGDVDQAEPTLVCGLDGNITLEAVFGETR